MQFKNLTLDKLKKEITKENAEGIRKLWDDAVVKGIEIALDNIFYPRQYIYYNHNLSAQGESQITKDKNISFYTSSVTGKANSEEFEKYLMNMSENKKFLDTDADNLSSKFKDALTEIVIQDKQEKSGDDFKAEVVEKSAGKVEAKEKKTGWLLSSGSPAMVEWTLNEKEIKDAFENNKSLTMTYKLTPIKKDIAKSKLDLISSNAKYSVNENKARNEFAGKILLDIKNVIIEQNLVEETTDTDKTDRSVSGKYADDKILNFDEDTDDDKPKVNPDDNNKPDVNPNDNNNNGNTDDNNNPDVNPNDNNNNGNDNGNNGNTNDDNNLDVNPNNDNNNGNTNNNGSNGNNRSNSNKTNKLPKTNISTMLFAQISVPCRSTRPPGSRQSI